MVKWNLSSKRKPSGGAKKTHQKKKKHQKRRDFLSTKIKDTVAKSKRTRGGGKKTVLLSADIANVSDKGTAKKTKILSVIENSANEHYVRRNIITKGAVIETEMGKAKVTSKPGKDGVVNAVLVKTPSS